MKRAGDGRLVGAAVVVALICGWATASISRAEEAADDGLPMRFNAIAQNMSNVGPRGQVRMDIRVTRWSTEEERQHLKATLIEGGTRSLTGELFRQDPVGTVREVQQLANDFRYSRRVPTEEGELIIMATDRPLSFAEVWRSSRTRDYNVTIVILNMPKEGPGQGQIMMGAELSWDMEKDQLVVEHFASEPVRLTRVDRQ